MVVCDRRSLTLAARCQPYTTNRTQYVQSTQRESNTSNIMWPGGGGFGKLSGSLPFTPLHFPDQPRRWAYESRLGDAVADEPGAVSTDYTANKGGPGVPVAPQEEWRSGNGQLGIRMNQRRQVVARQRRSGR